MALWLDPLWLRCEGDEKGSGTACSDAYITWGHALPMSRGSAKAMRWQMLASET